MTGNCLSCGASVSDQYIRVYAPVELEREGLVRCCPYCPSLVRDGSEVRPARSDRGRHATGGIDSDHENDPDEPPPERDARGRFVAGHHSRGEADD